MQDVHERMAIPPLLLEGSPRTICHDDGSIVEILLGGLPQRHSQVIPVAGNLLFESRRAPRVYVMRDQQVPHRSVERRYGLPVAPQLSDVCLPVCARRGSLALAYSRYLTSAIWRDDRIRVDGQSLRRLGYQRHKAIMRSSVSFTGPRAT